MDAYTRPDPTAAALLTIDVQNDFTLAGAPAEISGTAEAVPRMARLVSGFRAAGAPVVHVLRLYRPDGSNVDRCRRRTIETGTSIVEPGTPGAELVDALQPDADVSADPERLLAGEFQRIASEEWLAYKPRWSAFYGTSLEDFLSEREISTLVVCGCNFPNCPRTTVYDASARDFRLVIVPDATSGTYDRGLSELESIGVAVRETGEVLDWLEAGV